MHERARKAVVGGGVAGGKGTGGQSRSRERKRTISGKLEKYGEKSDAKRAMGSALVYKLSSTTRDARDE